MTTMKKKKTTEKEFQQILQLANGWMVKSSTQKKFLIITYSKKEAMDVAIALAKRSKTNIVIYPTKGEIVTIKDYAA
jgi:hypothetical protein